MAENELELVDKGAKRKKLLLIAIPVALVLLIAGGYFVFMGGEPESLPSPEAGSIDSGAAAAAASQGSALYVTMPRPFIFNVAGANRDRLVQIRVQIMVRGDANQGLALRHIPLIEGTLLKTFSAANADELITSTGKDALKNKALIDLQSAMLEVTGAVVVAEVLFTGFVMQ